MKLATVRQNDKTMLVAQLGEGYLLPIPPDIFSDNLSISLKTVIQGGEASLKKLEAFVKINAYTHKDDLIPESEVIWLPPVVDPGKICGVAMNNSASNARKISAPNHPAFFLKPASCLIGHGQEISLRSYYGSVHPEPELAVVVGKIIRDVEPEQVSSMLFGYSIFNDITGNGMRSEDLFRYYALYPKKDNADEVEKVEQHLSYAARYKGTDCFGVLGPWVVTSDEISNPDDLSVTCTVAGERVADDNTKYYNYKVAEIISFISNFHTLHPGDIVSMGTAFKPGATRKSIHHANFQTVGGPVRIEIERLGVQENPVAVEQRDLGRWRMT
ncbi:MAG: fumarylacetoacetate hydrolase family protein [Proteobacteria bacterium]|jgi:2,4-didehydro-3-deoxy-L-rhamnonate hydrolase|nr:fumarylacetoacetate hydrolase family protein [Pseudomonadota bacterium]